jgi:hypothetical protein
MVYLPEYSTGAGSMRGLYIGRSAAVYAEEAQATAYHAHHALQLRFIVKVPILYTLMKKIRHARSPTGRLFTEAESGEQCCLVGNHRLAVNCILV